MKFYNKHILHCYIEYSIVNVSGLNIAMGTKSVQGEIDEESYSASNENCP